MGSRLIVLLCFSALAGCGTMNAARPLEAGQHRVGFTFGGPFTTQLGPPIPAPMLLVEARSGLKPLGRMPLDANYGLNLTTLAFGDIGLHGGASLHIAQPDSWRPGLVITERLHVYNNFLDITKPVESRKLWGINEFDITATWALNDQRFYLGVTDALDLSDPELLVGPFFGIDLLGKKRRAGFHFETRLQAINFSPEVQDVTWVSLGEAPGNGVVQVSLGASWALGKEAGQ